MLKRGSDVAADISFPNFYYFGMCQVKKAWSKSVLEHGLLTAGSQLIVVEINSLRSFV